MAAARINQHGRNAMKLNKENVVIGTLILSASSIFVRMIGFVFRVYLSNTLGAEGMGLYSLIMSLYALCATVATSGISTAVSKLVAEQLAWGHRANAKRVLRRAIGLSLAISCTVGVVVFLFADFISGNILSDSRTTLSLRLLAPGMPFLSVSACLRGYFIAERHMGNPASGQVIEQLSKMAFIILLLHRFLPMGIEYGCAVVVMGITLGEAVCFLYSLGGYLLERRRMAQAGRADVTGVTKSILHIAVPISLSSYIRSALRLLEDVLILAGLKTFSGQDDVATGLYGMVKGMVMPLLLFPLQLLSAFVVTLTPEISRLGARGDSERMERTISMILRYTCIIGIFIVGIFMTFSYEMGLVVYKDERVGEMLKQMSWLCPFMCIETVVVGILQGLGEQMSSMRYNISDCVVRIALVYLLVPLQGVQGFVLMVVVSNLFTSLLNLRRLMKVTKLRLRWSEWFIKPALATLAAGQGVRALCNYWLFPQLSMLQGLVAGLCIMALLYLLVLMGIGSIVPGDLRWIVNRLKFSSKPPKTEPEPAV